MPAEKSRCKAAFSCFSTISTKGNIFQRHFGLSQIYKCALNFCQLAKSLKHALAYLVIFFFCKLDKISIVNAIASA